ncbi:glutamine ABC transporter permease [Collibacillus ludicampi]|jgi:putative glutamine transport system permease protein|uniref:Glutamine ABC transporter permease n=1 Tax=Collibacillus ludicampi TaxID=2771369 RepID=A0AAV4LFF8_9BACL|nr:amino acid ABC transporter permease [Collibacillus ludicampi]GIM46458.1 glutamine ABC transporter permease [Collibacillus ludicampi]
MDFAGTYSLDNIIFLLKGFLVTIEVAVLAILGSFIIGTIVGILRYTKIPGLSQLLLILVEVIRNLPLILIIFFVYFALPEVKIKMEVVPAAIVALTIFESALISEIVRSGLHSINKGQIEAARASGLTYVQTLWYIILPQALKRMIPPLVSQFISLIKDTSLAVIIALPELMHNGQIVYGHNVKFVIPTLLFVAMLYFLLNYSLSVFALRLEKRLST